MENSAGLSFPYVYQSQQGIALPNGMFSNGETQFSVNPLNVVLKQNQCRQLPALNELGDAARQVIEKANAVYTFHFFFFEKKIEYPATACTISLLVFYIQVSTFWEDDLQSVVQMGFGQNQQQQQDFHGE